MNKADISEIIKLFGGYCNLPLEFGGSYYIKNTGRKLTFTIKVE